MFQLRETLNSHLDNLVRPHVRVFHRSWSAFQVFSYLGAALGVVLIAVLTVYLGLSLVVMGGLVVAVALGLLVHLSITGIFPNYNLQLTVVGVATLFLWVSRQPILPYLDVTALGLGLTVACCRVGCLNIGCCHGRPYRWGVCYREEHAATGFTPYFVGVRLFPIQAIESLCVFIIVGVGIGLVLSNHVAGSALVWYAVMYAAARFGIGFLRADPTRSFLWGLSEAQWISLLVVVIVVAAEWAGVLPFHPWHAVVAVGLVSAAVTVALHVQFGKSNKYQLLHPHHIREVAEAVDHITVIATESTVISKQHAAPSTVEVARTSLGIQLSAGKIEGAGGKIDHYALSAEDGTLRESDAGALAKLLLRLKHHTGSSELITGGQGVFHLLVYPDAKH